MRPSTAALVFAGLSVALVSSVSAQSTCLAGRVSLSNLAGTTYVFGDNAFTVSYCSPGAPASSSLASCGATGYVQDHFVTNGTCRSNYPTIVTGLTEYTDGAETGVYFVVSADGATASVVSNVTVVCDLTGSATTASLVGVSDTWDGSTRHLHLRLSSYAGCAVSNLFCGTGINCADAGRTCVNGVCFDKSCAALTAVSSSSAASSAFSGIFSVSDCHGTPLANLTDTDFDISLNGISTSDNTYRGEVPLALATATQATPAITTLLLDQSASVVNSADKQALLQEAARTYVDTVASSNANHYVALIAFDGAASPVVVLEHTNDHARIIAAINNSLPPAALTDSSSTNLYGAVISGVRTANAMRFSFGPANASVVSSMIVFTDGFDTAARTTRAAAITEANRFASSVSIISIGVAETSDTAFLTGIATSGIFSFPSTTALVSSFADVAARVANSANSVYSAALCVPLRSNEVALAIRMNTTEGYTTSVLAEYSVNASEFTGGCTQSTVDALAASSGSANTTVNGLSTEPISIAFDETVTRTLGPSAALFVEFTPTSGNTQVRVTPVDLNVYYLTSTRCLLSPYCSDGSFNGTFNPSTATTYRAMVENGADATQDVTFTFASAVATPAPTLSVPTQAVQVTTATPQALSGPLQLSYNISEVGSGDVDEAAGYVFLGFALAMVAVLVVFIIFSSATGSPGESKHYTLPRQPTEPSFTVMPQYSGGGGDSMAYARTPSVGLGSPRSMQDRSGLQHTLMMSGGIEPIMVRESGVSPYRGTPYQQTTPVYGRHFDAQARWSPQRELDQL